MMFVFFKCHKNIVANQGIYPSDYLHQTYTFFAKYTNMAIYGFARK